MNFLTRRPPSGAERRAGWLPDPGVWLYVHDMLKDDFGVEVDHLPDHWIPLAIVGTLEWVMICGWWIFRNTGIFESDEPYKWVFEYDGYEFDPDQLVVFKEEADRNLLDYRIANPGLTPKERTEACQYLLQDIFSVYWQEKERTQAEAAEFLPPPEFVEMSMYATFMWILDEYGRNWIYMQDEVFSSVFDFGVAYLSRWDNTLLDPNVMICTGRELNSCRYCGENLWCVNGSMVDRNWQFVCNHCLMAMATETHHHLDEKESRISRPSCPHWIGVDGEKGGCMANCPHSGVTPDKVWEMLEEAGSERLETFRQHVNSLGEGVRREQLRDAATTIRRRGLEAGEQRRLLRHDED